MKHCTNHPDRPVKARSLCGSCYEVARRNGALTPLPSQFVNELVEELEFMDMNWDELEVAFKRPRSQLAMGLRRKGRGQLVDRVNVYTYGVTGTGAINSVLRKGKAFHV